MTDDSKDSWAEWGRSHCTRFDPNKHDIVLDPRDAAITPLNYRAWEDELSTEDTGEHGETPVSLRDPVVKDFRSPKDWDR